MIYFKSVKWKNLLSTGNVFTEMKLNKSSNTLVIGENGSGKSTFIDAISFALYDKPFRKVSKTQIINTINKKELLVEIEFDIGNKKYKIIRGRKPNVFEIYENGNMLNQDAANKDYQSILEEKILKLNHKSFSQIIVLGSASYVPFMQLSSTHRREIIEDLLDIQIFSTMNTLLKDKISDNKNQINECRNQINVIQEKINLHEQHIQKLKQNDQRVIDEKNRKIKGYKDQISNNNIHIEKLNSKLPELTEQVSKEQDLENKKETINTYYHNINNQIKNYEKQIEFFTDHDDCPTCKQGIDKNHKEHIMTDNASKVSRKQEGLVKADEKLKEITGKLTEIADLNRKITAINSAISEKNTQINLWNNFIAALQNEIKSQENNNDQEHKDMLDSFKSELTKKETNQEESMNEKEVLDVVSFLLKDEGIKSKIIKQYIPIMNKLINKYLAAMDFFVQFELNEKFDEQIKSRYRDIFTYNSFSEGEKMRIDLALLFTWRAVAKLRNSISTNLLIMDEVLDKSLDAGGTDEFLKIIADLTSDTNVFIISHKGDILFDKFRSVIKFEKVKNFSRMI